MSDSPEGPIRDKGGIGKGVGLGFLAQLVCAIVLFMSAMAELGGLWWLTLIVPVAAVVMMLKPETRRVATGILIASAAAWLVVLGPCVALITSL